jgi:hypothetical protein
LLVLGACGESDSPHVEGEDPLPGVFRASAAEVAATYKELEIALRTRGDLEPGCGEEMALQDIMGRLAENKTGFVEVRLDAAGRATILNRLWATHREYEGTWARTSGDQIQLRADRMVWRCSLVGDLLRTEAEDSPDTVWPLRRVR